VEIQQAYDILSDSSKRQQYDTMGSSAFDGSGGPGGPGGPGGFSGFAGSPFNPTDIFAQMFGMGSRGGFGNSGMGTSPGNLNIESEISIPFEDAVHGCKRNISMATLSQCSSCKGSGLKSGVKASSCGACRGSGQQVFYQSGFQIASTCGSCGGTGTTVPPNSSCTTCRGEGRVNKTKSVSLDIPCGVDDGMKVRFSGKGDEDTSGKAGDLFVRIRVIPSRVFSRRENGTFSMFWSREVIVLLFLRILTRDSYYLLDIHYTAKVPLSTALLGGDIRVPTIDGDVELKVPSGTQPGETKVLRGRGVKNVNNPNRRGDQFVEINVEIPKYVSALIKFFPFVFPKFNFL
jgi:molecular chaperone DnaJ